MSTYGSILESKLTSIGFMKVIPGLYRYMDLPDVVSMNVPGGLMVIHGTQDRLFTNEGVAAAFDKIRGVYSKAGVPERFQGVTYDGPHEFNAEMQGKAFAWLDRWLKPQDGSGSDGPVRHGQPARRRAEIRPRDWGRRDGGREAIRGSRALPGT